MRLSICTLGIFFLFTSAASSAPTAFDKDWRSKPLPDIRDQSGRLLKADGKLGELEERPRLIEYKPDYSRFRGVSDERSGCSLTFDTTRLLTSVKDILSNEHLLLAFQGVGAETVVIYTRPKYSRDRVKFYSYVAELKGCSDTCRLEVSSNLYTAPLSGDSILFSERMALADDDITNYLLEASDSLFQSCQVIR